VGLPSNNDMGNSEVGHNALGSGQIISQGAKLVNQAFENGSVFDNASWKQVELRGKSGATVHFLGLLSDGNVHSHIDHLIALIARCDQQAIKQVRIHCLLDGRDVDPRSAVRYVDQLEKTLEAVNNKPGRDYRIASAGGRMTITMDRYQADWDMVKHGYDTHVHGKGRPVNNVREEIERQYQSDPAITDQTLEPFVVVEESGQPVGAMKDGDATVFFNFRGDRAIEISLALEQQAFEQFDRGQHPEIYYCGMLEYDGDLHVPGNFLVNPPVIENTMIEYMCAEKLHTFAVSETQKFGHVTYFWNGNRSGYFDQDLETWVEIPSDRVAFNEAPEMKAREITDATIELLQSEKYRFGRINYANGDMVGHTGDVDATVRAVESVDQCLGELLNVVKEKQGILIFTADHGNADEMFVIKDGEQVSRTSHSLNQVPFVIFDSNNDEAYRLNEVEGAGLANVAATVFNLLGYRAPSGYEPSLLEFSDEPRSRRLIHSGAVVNLGLETVKLPNDEILALEIVRHPGGAVVIAMNDKHQVCLIKQFRHAANGWIWEFPAGLLEPFEDPQTAAIRELKEETGCVSDTLISLGSTLTTPGFCTERLHIYLAKDVTPGEAEPEDYEFIETHWMSLDRVNQMAKDGEIDDAKTIVALYRLNHFQQGRS
ncbi:MAG: 2,3-bisphosphoglycerate-independent phosphoglycerate mutase, partial [bacterium]